MGAKMRRSQFIQGMFFTFLLFVLSSGSWAKTITLSWDASPSTVTGYSIYYVVGSAAELAAANDPVMVDAGAALTYTLRDLDDAVEHSLAVTAYDNSGNESSYSNIVTSAAVIADEPTNSAPVLATIGSQSVSEGGVLSFTISATDADNDALSYTTSTLPEDAIFDATLRQFRWPTTYDNSTNNRIISVVFTASDEVDSASETVTITVLHSNRAPVLAEIGPQNLVEGEPYSIDIEASDPDGDTLTYTASGLPEDSVFEPLTRSFNWIPGDGESGTYVVTFVVEDADTSVSEAVTMTVTQGNQAPVLTAVGNQSVAEGSPLTFTLAATDADGDSLTFAVSERPQGATFDGETRIFSWTPDYTQAGTFTFICSVSDGALSDSEAVAVVVSNTNRAPTISGTPVTSIMATRAYQFTPTAVDPDGDSLTFSIAGKPAWATFDTIDGSLRGTPGETDIGSLANILISVSDGSTAVSLESFAIAVEAFVVGDNDSDGDGISDDLDAFPDDSNEWLDSDGDLIGNNADDDDDNDGISDSHDGAPLDAGAAGWIISAIAGEGGYLSPDGDTSVLYGGSQGYSVAAMDGYYLSELLIDGSAVELVNAYVFENISQHHLIEVSFTEIPEGLSCDPADSGLIGIERVDGGSDSNNHVDAKPKHDLDFRFIVKLKEDVAAAERNVYLVLDGYKYPLQLDSGALADGADYVYTTRLGPASGHSFYYLAENASGHELWRYPQSDTLPGPAIELLNGRNLVGISAAVNAYALAAADAVGTSRAYRWVADSQGYQWVDSGAPVTTGEGYIIKPETAQLPDLSLYAQVADGYGVTLAPGWNLISNPYGGNVNLADVWVQQDEGSALDWLSAVEQNLVIDMVYTYLGSDWGGNEFASAEGSEPAVLVPWVGYWIYVNSFDQSLTLVIEKPLQ
jgi:hypothetical protein